MKTTDDLERDLHELFTEIVADEPPLAAPVRASARGSTWTFTARTFFRGALAKGFATASLAGAVAVGAVVAPRVIEDRPADPGALVQPGDNPSGEPTPATAVDPGTAASTPRTTRYADERIGYALRHPSAWSRVGNDDIGENFVAFVSQDQISRGYHTWQQDGTCAPCPVAVAVELKNFAEHDEWVRLARSIVTRLKGEGVQTRESRATIAGRATVVFHLEWPDRAPHDPQDQGWCRGCVGDWFLVRWYHGTTLDLRVMGMDAAAYRRDGAAGLAIVRSVRDIGPPSERLMPVPKDEDVVPPQPKPTGDPAPDCTLRNGSIASSIECDTSTEAMMRFAAARIDGTGAEEWLSDDAKRSYDTHEGGLWLYTPDGERPYTSYVITERVDNADGTTRFTIEMNQGYVGDTGDRVRVEHVTVGAGDANWKGAPTSNAMMVLRASLITGPTEP